MPDNPNRKMKIPGHALDDQALLMVFLPKNSRSGLHEVKEFCHDRGHAAKVSRTSIAATSPRTIRFLHPGGRILGVKARGSEQHIRAGSTNQGSIRSRAPGILFQISA